MRYLLALDQGTTSSRSIIFTEEAQVVAFDQQELPQIYPEIAWVEHNPYDIWQTQLATAKRALKKAGLTAKNIHAIGLSNQRETTLIWNRQTGQPLGNAIVWQDSRTAAYCRQLRQDGLEPLIAEKTGLRLNPYFSASKLKWLLDHHKNARQLAEQNLLAFGNVDSWLLWQLSGGRIHACDYSNAARTSLFNIRTGVWDDELLEIFDIPPSVLPQVRPSSAFYGKTDKALFGAELAICGVAGDQQSALFGQACTQAGMAKNTYGTGCFALLNTGSHLQLSNHGLLSTPTANIGTTQHYALEGSVFVGGSVVQWLRDGLKAIHDSTQVEALAASVDSSDGVVFVPAFTGLGAPYWQENASGTLTGLSHSTTIAHVARAALESIAFQSAALLQAMDKDAQAAGSQPLNQLRVDGGASANNLLMQFQADLLGIPVLRPKIIETTALGAAFLAGLASGIYTDTHQLAELWTLDRIFEPRITREAAQQLMEKWESAVKRACLVA